MARYRIADVCCAAGGCSEGYRRAGLIPFGVDKYSQPRYQYEFKRMDALDFLQLYGQEFDAIHVSPPCQTSSWATQRWINEGREYEHIDFDELRALLAATGKPYVIENVVGAPLQTTLRLNGDMFGLGVIRDRIFESNVMLMAPPPHARRGTVKGGAYVTVAGHGGDGRAALHLWKDAMGIDWMNKQELTQAIPPAYTEFIGRQLVRYLDNVKTYAVQEAA